MENTEKLVAACWAMWSAIQLANSKNIYGEYAGLMHVAREAMIMCGQLEQESEKHDC